MRDVYQQVMAFNHGRDARFLPYKYQLMAQSPFRFFRGSCHLFYQDLVGRQTWQDPTQTWICGDLHVENFGSYRGRNRLVYFDLNDFDEAVLAPVTWEVSRFLTSVYLLGHQLNVSDADVKVIVFTLLETYLAALKVGKSFALEAETTTGVLRQLMDNVGSRNNKDFYRARINNHDKRHPTLNVNNKKYFAIGDADLKQRLIAAFGQHINQTADDLGQFEVLDAVIRLAGTGSVGLKRYMFLVYHHGNQQHYFFDIKFAQASSLQPYLQNTQPAWSNDAERVKTVQSYMAYMLPAWYSVFAFDGGHYIVKETQPEEDKMDFALCLNKPKKLWEACHDMARLMAYAQLRSTGRKDAVSTDALIDFANQHAQWQMQLMDYAHSYYQQVVQDHQDFCAGLQQHAAATPTPKTL